MFDGTQPTGRREFLRATGGLAALGGSLLAGCTETAPSEVTSSPTEEPGTGATPEPTPTPEADSEATPTVEEDETPTPEEDAEDESESPRSEDDVVDRTDEDVIEIELRDAEDQPFAFDPGRVRISTGTTVKWINTHDVFHTVTSTDSLDVKRPNGVFDESLSSEGATFEHVFDEPETVFYYCQPHSNFMDGTIEVV